MIIRFKKKNKVETVCFERKKKTTEVKNIRVSTKIFLLEKTSTVKISKIKNFSRGSRRWKKEFTLRK